MGLRGHTAPSAVLVWSGIVFAGASAVPLPPTGYAILFVTGVAFEWTRTRSKTARGWTAAALLVTVAGIVAASASARYHRGPILPADRPVFVVGDSLSAGIGTSEDGTWPHILSERRSLRVYNLARAGATLSAGAIQARAVPDGPAVVIVELGGNDLLGETTPERFSRELRTLLGALTAPGRRVVMFELTLLPLQNAYGRIQRQLCDEYGVDLIPRHVLARAIAWPGHTADGLHLSAQGHSWLAMRVARLWSNSFRNESIR